MESLILYDKKVNCYFHTKKYHLLQLLSRTALALINPLLQSPLFFKRDCMLLQIFVACTISMGERLGNATAFQCDVCDFYLKIISLFFGETTKN